MPPRNSLVGPIQGDSIDDLWFEVPLPPALNDVPADRDPLALPRKPRVHASLDLDDKKLPVPPAVKAWLDGSEAAVPTVDEEWDDAIRRAKDAA